MDALAAGIVAIAAALVRAAGRLVRAHGRRGARGDRLRRDARLPAPQLPPGEDLHGRLRRARAGLRARLRSPSRACSRRPRRSRSPRRCSCMAVPILDTSFVVAQAAEVPARAVGADQNHFYHRFLRIGFSQRRTAAYLHLWAALLAAFAMLRPLRAAAAARRLGPRQRAARRRRGPARDRPPRSGWSTRSRSSRRATCTSLGLRRFGRPARTSEREEAVEECVERTPSPRPALAETRAAPASSSSAGSRLYPGAAVRRRLARGLTASASVAQPAGGPRARACSSTPPSRPSKIDQTGVPSTAASRFIVPPADTSTSASATRLRPSTARAGTMTRGRGRARRRRPPARRCAEHDGLRVARRGEAAAARGAAAGSRSRRGRARRTARCARRRASRRRSTPSASSTRGVRLEVREVVLLLQPRVVHELGAASRRSARAARPGSPRGRARGSPAGSSRGAGRRPTRSRTSSRSGCAAARAATGRSVEPCASARRSRRPRPKRSMRAARPAAARALPAGARRRGGRARCRDGPSRRAARGCARAGAPSARPRGRRASSSSTSGRRTSDVRGVREVDPDAHAAGE